jgi:ArsR family metal-binding transcriptional regulator
MLLTGYRKQMIWSQCKSDRGCLRCLADLDNDISEVIPYLNAMLGGYQYVREPLAVTLKVDGKLVAVYENRIAINNLVDEAEADSLLEWLMEKINDAWARRGQLEPCFEPLRRPSVVDILKVLRHEDCRMCGEVSCVAYAVQLADGSAQPDACSDLPAESREKLREHLATVP